MLTQLLPPLYCTNTTFVFKLLSETVAAVAYTSTNGFPLAHNYRLLLCTSSTSQSPVKDLDIGIWNFLLCRNPDLLLRTMQYSLEVPWDWLGCHTPGDLDHDPVKPYWIPSTYQVYTKSQKNFRQTHKIIKLPRIKFLWEKWARVRRNQDSADFLPVLAVSLCLFSPFPLHHCSRPGCSLSFWDWLLRTLMYLFLLASFHLYILHLSFLCTLPIVLLHRCHPNLSCLNW